MQNKTQNKAKHKATVIAIYFYILKVSQFLTDVVPL